MCNKALARPAPSRHRSAPPSARAPGFPAGGPRPAPGLAPPAPPRGGGRQGVGVSLGPPGHPALPSAAAAARPGARGHFPRTGRPLALSLRPAAGRSAAARAASCRPESGHLARRRRALCQTRFCKVSADTARQLNDTPRWTGDGGERLSFAVSSQFYPQLPHLPLNLLPCGWPKSACLYFPPSLGASLCPLLLPCP